VHAGDDRDDYKQDPKGWMDDETSQAHSFKSRVKCQACCLMGYLSFLYQPRAASSFSASSAAFPAVRSASSFSCADSTAELPLLLLLLAAA